MKMASELKSRAFNEAKKCRAQQFTYLCDYLRHGSAVNSIDARGCTILHFLAIYGNDFAFKELHRQELLKHDDLIRGDKKGNTPLHEAAKLDKIRVVEFLVKNVEGLVLTRNHDGETPLYVAAACGSKDVFKLLQKENHSDHVMTRNDGYTVLHASVKGEYYGLAIDILYLFPHLAQKHDEKGNTPLNILATKPSSFKSVSPYVLSNLGRMPFIPLQFIAVIVYACFIPSTFYGSDYVRDIESQHENQRTNSTPRWLRNLIAGYRRAIRVCGWLKEVDDAKQKQSFALALAKRLLDKEKDWSCYMSQGNSDAENIKNMTNKMQNPLIQAARNNINELVKEIIERYPDAANSYDEGGKNLIHIAVEKKNAVLYEYLKKNVPNSQGMLDDVDNNGNTILHIAANAEISESKVHSGYINQMTWDICWFKSVRYDCSLHFPYSTNKDGKTAEELFEKNHNKLREESEKGLKEMNNALMIICTLLGTVNYAALFALPGGYGQGDDKPDYGLPVLLYKKANTFDNMVFFLWFIALGLFSSLLALVAMLSMHLSRFRTNDFYLALPIKFVVAWTSLIFSMGFTMAASFDTYILNGGGNALTLSSFTGSMGTMALFPFVSFIIVLVYIDASYPSFYYICHVLRSSLRYKGQEM